MLKHIFRLGITLVLFGSLSGCFGNGGSLIPPKADDVLHALRKQDDRIVQVRLKQCKRSNVYEGQEGAHPYFDLYHCVVTVERFDPILNQSLHQDEKHILSLSSDGWTAGSE
ncbi:hypothetical protein [Acinetobacter gerneri]|uniref:hypothetical protein n=1 Tax=Acinetobacter gerneri TaxID=202952 RepID=UPI003A846565